jgi:hypothetical protein
MTHGKGKKKKKWKPRPVKQPPRHRAWLWALVIFLTPIGLGYIFPNADNVSVVVFGWTCSLAAFAALVYLFWTASKWAWWQRLVAALLAASAVAAFAYKTIPDRLRPSFVLVSPLVWYTQGAWYFGFTHRGPKTCFSTKVLFTDEDSREHLVRTNQLSAQNISSFQTSLWVGEVNPKGHNLMFGAPNITWTPFSPLSSHFTAEVTWRDGGLHEDIRIARVNNEWQYSIYAKDHDTGKILMSCRDKNFPSSDATVPCYPDIVKGVD